MSRITDGLLDNMPYRPAVCIGAEIEPTIVIAHDTASRIAPGLAAGYLRKNDRKVSVHFVIERDGAIEQQVPVNRRANHAGRSVYHGRQWCNGFSIGVEMVNPGRMSRESETHALAWYGDSFEIASYGIQECTTPEHGHGLWMPYTPEQIATFVDLMQFLFDELPTLHDITTHWYVSPGRKVDTNPLFPLEQIRSLIFGREDPLDEEAEILSRAVGASEFVEINTPGDTLNMRRWPSFNPNVLVAIPHGTRVPVLRSGTFEGRDWHRVQYAGREGWIVADYADFITERQPA
ncbi:N-acetylmuramoyl-L-alanine amidase [Litorisediminicola beolgyonensis]|uniref:N-acetylmuramoyl-L-alanine amidase n=1 Tax=Litorisediminicola beolgyonensis TaxID=1173614 RepID=A0ABW3ZJH0_9RHOB